MMVIQYSSSSILFSGEKSNMIIGNNNTKNSNLDTIIIVSTTYTNNRTPAYLSDTLFYSNDISLIFIDGLNLDGHQ